MPENNGQFTYTFTVESLEQMCVFLSATLGAIDFATQLCGDPPEDVQAAILLVFNQLAEQHEQDHILNGDALNVPTSDDDAITPDELMALLDELASLPETDAHHDID